MGLLEVVSDDLVELRRRFAVCCRGQPAKRRGGRPASLRDAEVRSVAGIRMSRKQKHPVLSGGRSERARLDELLRAPSVVRLAPTEPPPTLTSSPMARARVPLRLVTAPPSITAAHPAQGDRGRAAGERGSTWDREVASSRPILRDNGWPLLDEERVTLRRLGGPALELQVDLGLALQVAEQRPRLGSERREHDRLADGVPLGGVASRMGRGRAEAESGGRSLPAPADHVSMSSTKVGAAPAGDRRRPRSAAADAPGARTAADGPRRLFGAPPNRRRSPDRRGAGLACDPSLGSPASGSSSPLRFGPPAACREGDVSQRAAI